MFPLVVENLSYAYRSGHLVLRDISFRAAERESIGIVGANGSGKSTLCCCLCGIIPHFFQGQMQGKVMIKGLNTKEIPVNNLAPEIGLVLQDPNDQIMMPTVEEEIAFSLENHLVPPREIMERVEETMELVGITRLRREYPYRLSGGEKQLVAIATVLALNPSIIIFDEVLSMLDERASRQILEVMNKLKEEKTLVIVDHTLQALPLFDRVLHLEQGKISFK